MQKLECSAVDELLPGFMLDALTVDEAVDVAEHLRTCARCRGELDAFRPAIESLAYAAGPIGSPPPKIKQQLLAQVRIESRPRAAARPRRVFRPIAALVPAAIGLIVIFGLGAWALSLQASLGQLQARVDKLSQSQNSLQQVLLAANLRAVPVKFEQNGVTATAVLYVSSNKAVLAVNGLPPTQDDTVYKCWWIDNANDILPGNAFKTDAGGTGLWVWQRPAGDEYHTLAITLEHRPDVTKAEGPLILSAGF